jgi:hypothetical protein
MRFLTFAALAGILTATWGCGGGGGGDADADVDADGDIDADADIDGDGGETDGDAGDADASDADDGDSDGDVGPASSISLPQAVGGALLANNAVYTEVPLRIALDGHADSVSVQFGGVGTIAAEPGPGDTTWTAMLPLDGLGEGVIGVEATATVRGADDLSASAELVIDRDGVQLTVWDEVGSGGTPRLHRRGDELWITWTDRRDDDARAWLQQLDGAGRFIGERSAIVDPEERVLSARAAFGSDSIGVLYQSDGMPYVNRLTVVDFDGGELLEPIDLDPAGWNGSWGGDIEFDGAAFVVVYRSYGTESSEVRWVRVVEESLEVVGPVVVAVSGPATEVHPNGSFEPFSFIDVAPVGARSLVGFVRGHYDTRLELEIPKAQLALVGPDGRVESAEYAIAGAPTDFFFARESRTFSIEDTALAIWSAQDLMDMDPTPPNLFFATRTDGDGRLDPERRRGVLMFDSVDDRDEPFLVPIGHPEHIGALAWFDHRAYTLEPAAGRIELYAAPVDEDLTTGDEVVFPHARVVAGTSLLQGTAAGTNALLVWIDERHGLGIIDPRPEVYFETAWF